MRFSIAVFLFPWSPQATTSRVGVCIGPQIPELILSKLPNKGRLKGTTNHLVSVSRSCTTTTLQPPLRASVHRCHQRPGPAPTSPRRSWAGTAARSPRAAPPPSRTCGVARWLRGLPSCRRGRGKLLALGPRYKTKLIFPAADRPMPGSTLSSSPRLNPTDSTTTAAAAAAAAAPTKL